MPRLITIYFSHYCDKARWALERAQVEFVEEPHVPGPSGFAAMMARGSRTVPVLVDGERVVRESADIVRWADEHAARASLFPEEERADIDELCATFDAKLGPATRRVAYDRVLQLPSEELGRIFSHGVPSPWEADLGRLLAFGVAGFIRRALRVTPDGVERSRAAIESVLSTVEARMKDGRAYLCGDAFTAADLTFAALAAPVIAPDYYRKFFPPRALDAVLEPLVTPYRERAAGKHALRMYELHR